MRHKFTNSKSWRKNGCGRRKSTVLNSVQIVALRVEVTDPRREIIGKQDDTVRAERPRHVDLFHSRLDRNSVSADACPDLSCRSARGAGRAFNLLLKDGCVCRISHRTSYVQNSHIEPTMPILKPPRVGVLIVCKHCRRDNQPWPALFDFMINAAYKACDLFALEVGELICIEFSCRKWILFQRRLQLLSLTLLKLRLQPLAEILQ